LTAAAGVTTLEASELRSGTEGALGELGARFGSGSRVSEIARVPDCTVGRYLLESLAAYGVRHIFGIPGVHNVELYRGLERIAIRHVVARHEQGLGFMADGYARVSGRPGVCFTITGPGVTNIATALAQARADSIPLLVIASVNRRGQFGSGRGFLHELPDQRGFAAQLCAFTHTVLEAAELPEILARAFARFAAARPGPAFIELPIDVLQSSAAGLPAPTAAPAARPAGVSRSILDEAARRLAQARAPLILAGGGALRAAAALTALAEHLNAPVIMTINGRGLLPPAHPLAISYSASLAPVRELIAASDAVLAVGTELGPTDYDMYALSELPQPPGLIRIDIDAEQMVRNARPALPLLGCARVILEALLASDLGPRRAQSPAARLESVRRAAAAALKPAMRRQIAVLDAIRTHLPRAIMVGDSTQPVYAGNLGFAAAEPGSWFNSATGFGTLGYALPASTGAGLAAPDRPVICLVGDGGVQFTLGELGVLRDVDAWTLVVVWNNRGYGEIKSFMIAAGIAPAAVDIAPPDFARMAQAYGYAYRRVAGDAQLHQALEEFARRRQIVVMEVEAAAFDA
jgi:acetolactate synthase-1/2/3 large subunit